MMRTQIPKFRLPEQVIDEEVGYILDSRPSCGSAQRIEAAGRAERGLRRGLHRLRRAARARPRHSGPHEAAANIHIGIEWLASVAFGHVERIGKRVIVLGGGNTAMDCCRTARRLGGEDVKVVVR